MTGKERNKNSTKDAMVRSLKGVAKSTGFSIAKNGSVGIVFNPLLDQFTIIDLTSGESVIVLNKDPLVKVKNVSRWGGLHVIERQSKYIALMLAVEKRTDKTYLISFTEDKAEKRMKVVDELDLGVLDPKEGKEGSKKISYIGENGHGAIYCFTTWLEFNGSPDKATFHAVEVNVDNKGKLKAKILFNARSVQGAHLKQPFAHHNAVYMLPVYNLYDEEQIIKLPIKGASTPEIISVNYGEGGMPSFFCPWSQPTHLNDTAAIFYIYGLVGSHQVGQFWTLDLPKGQWRKLNFELQEHAVKDNIVFVHDVTDGSLLLHGDCADNDCADKAHIYRFNFDKVLAAKPIGLALPSAKAIKRKQTASSSSKAETKSKGGSPAKKPKISPKAANSNKNGHAGTSGRLTRSQSRR